MAKKYSTTFAADEDPLSESGAWQARVNTILTDMKSVAATGRANAKALGLGAYDDSAALLTGYAADVELTCTVFKDVTINTGAGHECEILHRASQTTTVSTQYECLFSFNGNIQCFRWFSNGGTQDFELQTALLGGESKGGEFVTGDRIRARICGSILILSYLTSGGTETLLGVYNNTVVTSGQPGIGGFIRSLDGAVATKFCFSDAQISDIFAISSLATDDCARSNEAPLSKSGAWVTASGMNALNLTSNRILTATANSDSGMRYTGVTAGVDHYAEVTIGTVGDGDFGAAVCMMANGDCYLTTNFNASSLFIFERIGGGFNQLANPAGTYAPGDVIRLERFGSYLRIYQNGTLKDTVSANVNLLGGTFGIFGYDGNFRISAWAGGNIVATYDAVPGAGGGGTTTTQTLSDTTTVIDQLLSSATRGRYNSDTLSSADGFVSSAVRGQYVGDVFTIADGSFGNLLRGVVASDQFDTTDELRYFLIRNRLLEDGYVITDGFISSLTASQIITLIATSLAQVSDEGFLYLLRNLSAMDLLTIADSALASTERNILGSDSTVIDDQGIRYLGLTRQFASSIEPTDSQFSFRRLTRRLEESILAIDSSIGDFIDGTGAMLDGSKILIGAERRNVVLGADSSIVLGSNNLVRIH